MPQIAIIQAPAPQGPPPGQQANNDSENFAPHLDNAIANRKGQPSKQENGDKVNNQKTVGNSPDQEQKIASKEGVSIGKTDEIESPAETEDPVNNMLLVMEQIASSAVTAEQTGDTAIPTLVKNLAGNSPLFQFLSNKSASNSDDPEKLVTTSQPTSWMKISDENLLKISIVEATAASPTETSSLSLPIQIPETKPGNDDFLLHLQKIIENSGESGQLTITVAGNTLKGQSVKNGLQLAMPAAASYNEPLQAAVTSTDFSENKTENSAVLLPNSSEIVIEKNNQSLSSTRHSIHQQYYEEKIAPQYNLDDQTPEEGSQQGNTFSPKTTSTGEGTSFTFNPDQTNTFSQPLAGLQEGQKPPAAEVLRPVTLPSGTVIHQEEVIRQIAEHLQISRRDYDTKVSIQLHPAELGEMKISLSVKEGAVRANVVASSQFAQEILEKNMVKLKTILESQGFTIDQISVTAKSDTVGDFNLFDRHLFSQNDYQPPAVKNTHIVGPLFTMVDTAAENQAAVTGVNVKA
jgi:flagellar hook-length control protein FliK